MLKTYIYRGLEYQFEEGEQPEEAVEVKAEPEPSKKAAQPANKSRKAVRTK